MADYPRPLTPRERDWIRWLLPDERPGYAPYAASALSMPVIGEGRWGRHDFILGPAHLSPDLDAGMRPTVAVGEIDADPCGVTLSVHEPDDEGRMEIEISPRDADAIPLALAERARRSLSYWNPSDPCPFTGNRVREVRVSAPGDADAIVLAISSSHRRLWLHHVSTRFNQIIPPTNLYAELMIDLGIRDPATALAPARLFTQCGEFTDAQLARAFALYNVRRHKVDPEHVATPAPPRGLIARALGRIRGADASR